LLSLLALGRRQTQARDKLVAFLWPETDAEHARHYLTVSLYELRRALGADAIVGSGDEVALNRDIMACDVAQFEDAIARGDFELATALYAGPLLDGFHIADAAEFTRCIERERDRLARVRADALRSLAEHRSRTGDRRGAVEALRQLVAQDPLDSPSVLRLMEALDALGDRAEALQLARLHASMLKSEVDAGPDPAITALATRLRSAPSVSPAPLETPPGPTGIAAPIGEAPGPALPPPRPRLLWAIGLAVTAVVAGVGIALASHRGGRPRLAPPRVVVAAFDNRSGDSALTLLGQLAADWITRGLVQTELVQVADFPTRFDERETSPDLANRSRAMGSTPTDTHDVRALAKRTGAGLVVWGSLYRTRDTVRFEARITDARSGEVLRAIDPVSGPVGEPREAVERLRQRVTGSLATLLDPRLTGWSNVASQPPTYEAYREFVDGVDAFNRLSSQESLRHLYAAAQLDSTYTMPLVIAARVHAWVNECGKADSIGGILGSARALAGPVERALLDEALAYCHGDPEGVYRAARRLADALPGSDFAEARVGRYAVQINRPREALAHLDPVDPAGGAVRGWFPYYVWLTMSLHMLGEHDRELAAAERGRRQYPGNLAMDRIELFALAALGRVHEVNDLLDEITSLPPAPVRRPAATMIETALELRAHGYPAAARDVLGRALRWFATRPAGEQATELFRFDLAQALFAAGAWDSAYVLTEPLARRHPDSLGYQGLLGVLAARRGRRLEAEAIDRRLAAITDPYAQGVPTYWRAAIATQLGQRDRAVELLGEAWAGGLVDAIRASRKMITGPTLHSDLYFESLRDYPPFQELVRPKG
jgi:DNA-binding SARP family transcriptional activator/TolB-like protein